MNTRLRISLGMRALAVTTWVGTILLGLGGCPADTPGTNTNVNVNVNANVNTNTNTNTNTNCTPTSHASYACDGGDVFWYDSCAGLEELKESCEGYGCTGDACNWPPEDAAPVLLSYRVEDANRDRVYFDSSKVITASTVTGYVISGKTITSVTVQSGTTGHYFVVSEPFTFWDNNTIRYEGGSDTQDLQGNPVLDFTLTYIANNIPEPGALLKEIYVDGSVSSSGNGTSEAQAFKTLQEGVDAWLMGGGSTVWVKAFNGAYTDSIAEADNGYNGAIDKPQVIKGYKTTPGDLDGVMYYHVNVGGPYSPLDPTEMPLFDGGDRGSGLFFSVRNDSYKIFKNIQITNYEKAFFATAHTGTQLDNVLIKDIGATHENTGIAIQAGSNGYEAVNARFTNVTVINATGDGVLIVGTHNLVDHCQVYSNEAPAGISDYNAPSDYYYMFRSSNNIIRNSLCYKDTPNGDGHSGHGFTFKANDTPTEYNLVDQCEAVGILGSIEFRHPEVRFNVAKDVLIRADIPNARTSQYGTGGVNFMSGASDNIAERITGHDLGHAIVINANTEDNSGNGGSRNLVRNSVFYNILINLLWVDNAEQINITISDNRVYNCTFHNVANLGEVRPTYPTTLTGNTYKNCLFSSIPSETHTGYNYTGSPGIPITGWSYEYTATWDVWLPNGTPLVGAGNLSIDPQYTDTTDFVPEEEGLRAGTVLTEVQYDRNLWERADPPTIGAVEMH